MPRNHHTSPSLRHASPLGLPTDFSPVSCHPQIPGTVAEFINTVTSRWAFSTIIPAHFNAPAPATPLELQRAFAFAYEQSGIKPAKPAAASQPFWQAFTGPALAHARVEALFRAQMST